MKTILDSTFTEYFRPESLSHSMYWKVKNATDERWLNDIIKAKGYLTFERLAEVLQVYITPDEIEDTKVLRYEPGKILRVNRKQVDTDVYKISFTYEEEKANENH